MVDKLPNKRHSLKRTLKLDKNIKRASERHKAKSIGILPIRAD